MQHKTGETRKGYSERIRPWPCYTEEPVCVSFVISCCIYGRCHVSFICLCLFFFVLFRFVFCTFTGRDFLVATGVLPAIEWQILATETKTELTVAAGGIRLRHMTLADLLRVSRIDRATLERLCVMEVPIEPLQCYVLPSMKTATAIAASFKVCSDCPYRSFQELKRFWKNTYGYRIPEETERTMIYVKVRFRASSDRCYVYPILCVRPTEPQPWARVNPYPIMGAFLQCVKLRMGQVCGQGFPLVSRSPAFPTSELLWTAKDAQTEIDKVSWTPRPRSAQVPYRPKVSFEAKPVTVFIGDVEIVPESDEEVEGMEQSNYCSSTKMKPCFGPKQSGIHDSRIDASASARPLDAPGCSRERLGNTLASPQAYQRATATAFPAVVEWLNSCEFPVVQQVNNEITAVKKVPHGEPRAPRATCTDPTSYKTQTVAFPVTARSQQTLQGQQPCSAAVTVHKSHGFSEGESPEEVGSKLTNQVKITQLPQQAFTQLGASKGAPTLNIHDSSSGRATKNAMSGHSGYTRVAQQPQKTSAQFGEKWDSLTTPAQNINDVSRGKTPGNETGGITNQLAAQLAGGTSTQLGKMWDGSTATAQNVHGLSQRTTSLSSGGMLPTPATIDQPAQQAFSTMLKGMWDGALSKARNTPTFDNDGIRYQNAQTTRKPQLLKLGQPAEQPGPPPAIKQSTESLSLNKTNGQQRITFDRRKATEPRPSPATKQSTGSLSIYKTNDQQRITFDRHDHFQAMPRAATSSTKTSTCAGEKAGQEEKTSFLCVANTVNADEDPTAREIASQPLESAPKETDDLPTFYSTQVEGRKASRKKASTRKCWTIPEVDSLLRDKKFDMLSKVNSTVLLAWLCHNNIPCNIKTKKSEILSKVIQHATKG
ncbi:uncharacterized protein [Dermacentor andersoni]|uniref:uncharacterized protein isoform X1 n=1 Tax=Dermacentor andersoni TaxID=34620 RepID=UPI003B3B2D1A